MLSFLQSLEWEEFQRSIGRKTRRIENILLIRHDMPGGFNYFYAPRPDFSGVSAKVFFKKALEVIREEHAMFLKIDPDAAFSVPGLRVVLSSPLQPPRSVLVNLRQSEDEILRGMHEKTRYNIRLALRRGVWCRPAGDGEDALEIFWNMLRETAARDGFRTHQRRHYQALCATHSESFSNELFFAHIGDVPVASAIANFYRPSGIVTYLHGASGREHRDFMAPQLLHWYIMQEAKRRGFLAYDLWGIDEKRWPGLTRFKKGFGGFVVEHPASYDVVAQPFWYALYRIARRFL